jgi:fatty acid desaturase
MATTPSSDADAQRSRPGVRVVDGAGPRPPLDLSYSSLRKRFADELRPRKSIYWPDMLASMLIGWSSFALALRYQSEPIVTLAFSLVTVFALYRAILFIHEITHLKRGAVPGFETAWNLTVGVPLMAPSMLYVGSHNDHHRRAVFGTAIDPEYDTIGHWTPWRVVASGLPMLLVPAVLALRWAVLGPVSYLIPPLRRVVVERASALVINPRYRRKPPQGPALLRWALQEAATAAYVWAVILGVWRGYIPVSWIVHLYVITAAILLVNHVRTLAAHRYIHLGGELSREGQLLDSVNLVSESLWTKLVAPVGLRYHALHHVLPGLPYHSLGAVHRALCRELPSESSYHRVSVSGVGEGLRNLLRDARNNSRGAASGRPPSGSPPKRTTLRADTHRAA